VPLDGLEALDAEVSERVRAFQSLLFNTCTGLGDVRLNVCAEVLDVCTARLLGALPMLRMLQPAGPIIARVDRCAAEAGIRRDGLLRVSMALEETYKQDKERGDSKPATEPCATDHQTALIRELLEANRLLVNRLEALEAKADGKVAPRDIPVNNSNVKPAPQITRKKKAGISHVLGLVRLVRRRPTLVQQRFRSQEALRGPACSRIHEALLRRRFLARRSRCDVSQRCHATWRSSRARDGALPCRAGHQIDWQQRGAEARARFAQAWKAERARPRV
jgi:hypothetical protein